MLNFIPVDSSSIEAVKYDQLTSQLLVLFKQGGVYKYEDVSEKEYEKLLKAESVGSYFHKFIRNSKKFAKMNG